MLTKDNHVKFMETGERKAQVIAAVKRGAGSPAAIAKMLRLKLCCVSNILRRACTAKELSREQIAHHFEYRIGKGGGAPVPAVKGKAKVKAKAQPKKVVKLKHVTGNVVKDVKKFQKEAVVQKVKKVLVKKKVAKVQPAEPEPTVVKVGAGPVFPDTTTGAPSTAPGVILKKKKKVV